MGLEFSNRTVSKPLSLLEARAKDKNELNSTGSQLKQVFTMVDKGKKSIYFDVASYC